MPAVALLGTGIMGAPMARNLLKEGMRVTVWNRTKARALPLEADGATVADSPAQAVEGADIVITMLNDGAAVLEAMTAAVPGLRAGQVWAQMSTVGVVSVQQLAAFAGEHGLVFFDAPVQGTKQPAEQGKLVVLAAGPRAARTTIEPVFQAVGSRTLWLDGNGGAGAGAGRGGGEGAEADAGAGASEGAGVGTGRGAGAGGGRRAGGGDDVGGASGMASRLKLAGVCYGISATAIAAEALALAEGLGLDPALFGELVTGGPMDNPYLQAKIKAILAGDYEPSFAVRNAAKDIRLIAEAAEAAGIKVDLALAAGERLRRAEAQGHGNEDMAATYFASFS